jgi:hypothetical protein
MEKNCDFIPGPHSDIFHPVVAHGAFSLPPRHKLAGLPAPE